MSTSAPIRPPENATSDPLHRRESVRHSRFLLEGVRENREPHVAVRERRIDRIEAGKSRFWRIHLRVSELVTFLVFVPSVLFLWWQSWAYWALVPACALSVGGMWAFAQRMRPYESRLCRHMMFLARHRRRCAMCRYCIQGLSGPHCPECAFEFDPNDDSHLLIPLVNQMYSRQGRQVASVAIVAVMIAVVLMANDAAWIWHVAWSAGLLLTLHGFLLAWVMAARQRRHEAACGIRGTHSAPVYNRLLSNPLLLRCRYVGLLLRWAFLSTLIGGLTAITNLDGSALRVVTTFGGPGMAFVSLGIPMLAYVVVISGLMRVLMNRLHTRQRRMLATIG